MKTKGMRLWAGQQKRGIVVGDEWKGAEPLWNVAVWVRSGDVQRGLKVSEVAEVIKNALEDKFPSYDLEIALKAKDVLARKYDGLGPFPHSSS